MTFTAIYLPLQLDASSADLNFCISKNVCIFTLTVVQKMSLIIFKLFVFLGFFSWRMSSAMFIDKILKENVMSDSFVAMYIPTLVATNEKCRNDSLLYASELKKYKLWAAESEYINKYQI